MDFCESELDELSDKEFKIIIIKMTIEAIIPTQIQKIQTIEWNKVNIEYERRIQFKKKKKYW